MIHLADPPTLLSDVIPDLGAVVQLLEENAPYTPLGGWFRPGQAEGDPSSPMWFQNDWVHADLAVRGSDLFVDHERVTAAAREFYDAEVVVPHTLYVNLMACIEKSGPAHTDNPVFQGRDRTNTPMWLLRTMFWSGLFEHWGIRQATSIWWMNDVEGGGFRYWPHGPDRPPERYREGMANTAMVGDNHGMFHQVEPIGPFDQGTRLVTSRAELAPVGDGSGDWQVMDRGAVQYRAALGDIRVSVLWKAHIYANEEDRRIREGDVLSLEQVAEIFAADFSAKGLDLRLDLDRLMEPAHQGEIAAVYPEARPREAAPSIFDAYT